MLARRRHRSDAPPAEDQPEDDSAGLSRRELFGIFGLGWHDADNDPGPAVGLTAMQVGASCTSCGACVQACQPQVLQLRDDGSLIFKVLACTGCGVCVTRCPEQAIALNHLDEPPTDVNDGMIVHQGDLVYCRQCGHPVGSRLMLEKVANLTGRVTGIDDRCPDCRTAW